MRNACWIIISGNGTYESFIAESELIDMFLQYANGEFGHVCAHYRSDLECWDITFYQNRFNQRFESWASLNLSLSEGNVYYDQISMPLDLIRVDISNRSFFYSEALDAMISWVATELDLSELSVIYKYIPQWDDQAVITIFNQAFSNES